jgi:hypothetical protein
LTIRTKLVIYGNMNNPICLILPALNQRISASAKRHLTQTSSKCDFSETFNVFLRVLRSGFAALMMALLGLAYATAASAQEHDPMDHEQMDRKTPAPAKDPAADSEMAGMDHMQHGDMAGMDMSPDKPADGSGTSRLPGNEGAMHGVHIMPGDDWMVMLHGYAWGVYTNQSGPRGDDGFYVQSMAMVSAEKETGWGRIQLRSMLSLEPLMKNRGYPNLFATGETAGGQPLIDRQHPHDLFMELAGRVDVNVGNESSVFLYGGPVGEPALGPSAFMHRGSAKLNPEAPITHHWFDSSHITYGVATIGFASPKIQIEGSLFTGREPDERRWNIEKPRFDSWSVRATWNPSANWAVQASTGRLKTPEFSVHPDEDEQRTTASVHYANGSGLSAMLGYSAKHRIPGPTLSAWLAEANWDIDTHHTLFGRFENVKNDELFPNSLDPLHEVPFRVSKLQLGYAYRLPLTGPVNLALGGSLSAFAKPAALDTAYGKNPMGFTLFARFSLGH